MKKIIYLVSILSLSVGLFSCDQDIDYPYEGKDRIQFKHFDVDNNNKRVEFYGRTFSFGLLADSILTDTAKVVVELLGRVSDVERTYKISVLSDSTTAVAGEHYQILNETQTFRKGKVNDTLRIVINREKLNANPNDKENRTLYLDLVPTDDFDLGLTNGRGIMLTFNNYMSEPKWWGEKGQQAGAYGFFHPKKWKILIGFNEKFASYENLPFDRNSPENREYSRGLESYLNAIPTYDDYTGDRIKMNELIPQEKN